MESATYDDSDSATDNSGGFAHIQPPANKLNSVLS